MKRKLKPLFTALLVSLLLGAAGDGGCGAVVDSGQQLCEASGGAWTLPAPEGGVGSCTCSSERPLWVDGQGCQPSQIDNPERTGNLRVATFNIQVFGPTKAGKADVMQTLASVIRKYDIVAVQEIKDAKNNVPGQFLAAINEGGTQYAMAVSPRTGLQADDATSQEQYAFYYDTAAVRLLDSGALYDDSANDSFQREPFVARFASAQGNFTFALINIHTRPEAAVEEIGALADVFAWARARYPEEDDVIALGDFNAGCSYASPTQLDKLALRGASYSWLVPDSSDSNLAQSQCAYDRIVTTRGTDEDFTGTWGVDQAFQDTAISDHWPVWAEFSTSQDTQLH